MKWTVQDDINLERRKFFKMHPQVLAGHVCSGCYKPFQVPHGYPEYCEECDDKAIKRFLDKGGE